jgi:hypothetical protein
VQQLLAEQGSRLKVDLSLLEKKHDAGFTKACRDPHILPGSKELLKFLTRKHIRWAIATTGGKEQTAEETGCPRGCARRDRQRCSQNEALARLKEAKCQKLERVPVLMWSIVTSPQVPFRCIVGGFN